MKTPSFLKYRVILHLLFWFLSFYVLGLFFAREYDALFTKITFIYTLLFHLSIWTAVYPNLLVGIPVFLQKGKYLLYFIFILGVVLLSAFFNLFVFNDLSNLLFPDYYFISYYELKHILQFLTVYVILTTLLKLSKAWFQLAENQRLMDDLENAKLDAELNALKSQINPHFLFNSLNNLYSLALEEDQKTPEVILKLSESMRYMLYDSNVGEISLEKEIAFLNNYLELQRLRVDNKAKITFEVKGAVEERKIAPLLLLPFVENGFKHGIKGEVEETFIEIELGIEGEHLFFNVRNNKGEVDTEKPKEAYGFGLKNVRRRLELLYPQMHHLDIIDQENLFEINLKIFLRVCLNFHD